MRLELTIVQVLILGDVVIAVRQVDLLSRIFVVCPRRKSASGPPCIASPRLTFSDLLCLIWSDALLTRADQID